MLWITGCARSIRGPPQTVVVNTFIAEFARWCFAGTLDTGEGIAAFIVNKSNSNPFLRKMGRGCECIDRMTLGLARDIGSGVHNRNRGGKGRGARQLWSGMCHWCSARPTQSCRGVFLLAAGAAASSGSTVTLCNNDLR